MVQTARMALCCHRYMQQLNHSVAWACSHCIFTPFIDLEIWEQVWVITTSTTSTVSPHSSATSSLQYSKGVCDAVIITGGRHMCMTWLVTKISRTLSDKSNVIVTGWIYVGEKLFPWNLVIKHGHQINQGQISKVFTVLRNLLNGGYVIGKSDCISSWKYFNHYYMKKRNLFSSYSVWTTKLIIALWETLLKETVIQNHGTMRNSPYDL